MHRRKKEASQSFCMAQTYFLLVSTYIYPDIAIKKLKIDSAFLYTKIGIFIVIFEPEKRGSTIIWSAIL